MTKTRRVRVREGETSDIESRGSSYFVDRVSWPSSNHSLRSDEFPLASFAPFPFWAVAFVVTLEYFYVLVFINEAASIRSIYPISRMHWVPQKNYESIMSTNFNTVT